MKLKKLLLSVLGLAIAVGGLALTSGTAQAASEWEPSQGYHWYPTTVTIPDAYPHQALTYTKPGLFFHGPGAEKYETGWYLPTGSQWKIQGYYITEGSVAYDLGGDEWVYGSYANIPVHSAADAILSVLAHNSAYLSNNIAGSMDYQHVYGGQWDPFISGYWGGPYVGISSKIGKFVVYQDGSVHNVNFLY